MWLALKLTKKIYQTLNKKFPSNSIVIVAAIAIISFLLRFYKLEERFDWTGVEGSFLWDIWYVAQGHIPLVGFESAAIGHLNFPPFQLWFLTPFFLMAKGNPIYAEIILILFGVLSSILFFVVGNKIFGFRVGIIASLTYVISLHAIISDRKFIGGAFMIPISLITILLLWNIYKKKTLKIFDVLVLGSVIGIGFSTHYQSIFLLAGSIVFLILYKKVFRNIKYLLIFFLSTAFWLTPLLIFDLRHNFYTFKGFLILLTQYTKIGTANSGFFLSAQYVNQNFFGFFWNSLYSFQFQNYLPKFILVLAVILLIVIPLWMAKYVNLYQKNKPILSYFSLLIFLGYLTLSFYRSQDYNFDYYYWFLIPVFIFTIGLMVNYLLQFNLAKIVIIPFLTFLLFLNLNDFLNYKTQDSYKAINNTITNLLTDARNKNLESLTIKFEKAEVGAFDYLIYYHGIRNGFSPTTITLISIREHYQERSILGSGRSPIKIISRGASAGIKPNYLIKREDLFNFAFTPTID